MLGTSLRTILAVLLATVAIGCGGHKPSRSASTAAGATSGTPGTPSTPGVDVSGTGLVAAQANVGNAPFVASSFTLEATSVAQQRITRIDVASAGSIDETTVGALQLIEDTNGNGQVDPGETSVGSAPVAATDNATYQVLPTAPLVLVNGTPRDFLVVFDMTGSSVADQTAAVGDTLDLSIADALSVQGQDDQGNASTINGAFPLTSGTVTLELGDTVMVSEICPGPGTGNSTAEFVELFNATASPVDLSDYYITDMTDNPANGNFYWKLPSGQDFTNFSSDWIVRFPAGATIAPGQIITVALDGGGFNGQHGSDATYCMRNKAATASIPMLTHDGLVGTNFVLQDISTSGGLTGPGSSSISTGESVFIFIWDGASDLIVDVDIINYGNSTSTNTAVDKSPNQTAPGSANVKVDGPDADSLESTFSNDSSEFFQFDNRAPNGVSINRIDFSEGTEIKTGGNGLTGNDETSEAFGDGIGGSGTFEARPAATPGTIQ